MFAEYWRFMRLQVRVPRPSTYARLPKGGSCNAAKGYFHNEQPLGSRGCGGRVSAAESGAHGRSCHSCQASHDHRSYLDQHRTTHFPADQTATDLTSRKYLISLSALGTPLAPRSCRSTSSNSISILRLFFYVSLHEHVRNDWTETSTHNVPRQ